MSIATIIKHPLGQIEKRCSCGWHGSHFLDITASSCPNCKSIFQKNPLVLVKDSYCANCGRDSDNEVLCWRCK